MKNITQYIKESLVYEAYNVRNICNKIEQTEGFDSTIKASDKPEVIYISIFDKKTGELVDTEVRTNDKTFLDNTSHPEYEWYVWADKLVTSKYNLLFTVSSNDYDYDGSVYLVDNTKKRGICIAYFEKNNLPIIEDFVKNNIAMFDIKANTNKLTTEEINTLDKFFSAKVKNYEKIVKDNGNSFAAYFPDRNTAKNLPRLGVDEKIPHITISKPNRSKGNFNVCTYKAGNWAGTEWPDRRKLFDNNGAPRYSNISSVIQYLEHMISLESHRLGAELK